MQSELTAAKPELNIEILGVNRVNQSSYNQLVRSKVAVTIRREWGADGLIRAFIGELSFSRTRLSALLIASFPTHACIPPAGDSFYPVLKPGCSMCPVLMPSHE